MPDTFNESPGLAGWVMVSGSPLRASNPGAPPVQRGKEAPLSKAKTAGTSRIDVSNILVNMAPIVSEKLQRGSTAAEFGGLLEGVAHLQHREVLMVPADDLEAYG